MDTNNKASTSRDKSDSSDDDDEHHKNLSVEQLCHKIKTCSNLFFENNINDSDKSIAETPESISFDYEDHEQIEKKNDEKMDDELVKPNVSGELNPEDEDENEDEDNDDDGDVDENDEEDEDALADIETESKMDITVLKKEISEIIDEECVETDPNSEWSSKLSFFNLLVNLRINERDDLSIPIVFVGLIHLANERCLKLSKEHCTINDMEETFIAKPMKKK